MKNYKTSCIRKESSQLSSVYAQKEHARIRAGNISLRKALLRPPHQLTHHVPLPGMGIGPPELSLLSQKKQREWKALCSPALLLSSHISSHTMLRKEYLCGRLKARQVESQYQMAALVNGLQTHVISSVPGRPGAVPAPRRHVCPKVLGGEGTSRETHS